MVTKTSDVREVRMEYEVLIVIQEPKIPPAFLSALQQAKRGMNTIPVLKKIELDARSKWKSRLDVLYNLVNINRIVESSTIQKRQRRRLLDVVGQLSKSLFGTATVSDVRRIANAVKQSRGQQEKIIHQVNDMLTVVNHSNHEIQANRDRLNSLTRSLTKTALPINILIGKSNNLTEEVNKLKVILMVEEVISDMERCASQIKEQLLLYRRQKVQLEGERLSEDLLSQNELKHIIDRQVGGDIVTFSPLNWYYEFCVPKPVWTGTDLIYQVVLPLISTRSFDMFNLQTFPVLANDSKITTELKVQSHIAVDAISGRELYVHMNVPEEVP